MSDDGVSVEVTRASPTGLTVGDVWNWGRECWDLEIDPATPVFALVSVHDGHKLSAISVRDEATA